MNLLFVCSRNQWRSPTAEMIYKSHQVYKVRSAGTSESARIRINDKLLNWADVVFVMERKHKLILLERFSINKPLLVLDIPDDYVFMDPELVDLIRDGVNNQLTTFE